MLFTRVAGPGVLVVSGGFGRIRCLKKRSETDPDPYLDFKNVVEFGSGSQNMVGVGYGLNIQV